MQEDIKYMFIDRFIEIGFKQVSNREWTGRGWTRELKYYTSYLINKHYTLITFSQGKDESLENCEYRLYVHNADGSYSDSIFQTTYKHSNSIKISNEMFDETFKQELKQLLRTKKLNTLI